MITGADPGLGKGGTRANVSKGGTCQLCPPPPPKSATGLIEIVLTLALELDKISQLSDMHLNK